MVMKRYPIKIEANRLVVTFGHTERKTDRDRCDVNFFPESSEIQILKIHIPEAFKLPTRINMLKLFMDFYGCIFGLKV